MRLIVPHLKEVHPVDARLIRLAEFLGAQSELLRLPGQLRQCAERAEQAVLDRGSCLVINPHVMREWLEEGPFSEALFFSWVSRFPYVLLHAVSLDPFVNALVAAVSGGKIQSVLPAIDATQLYEVSPNSREICGSFSGLSFGPINAANDRVFAVSPGDLTVQGLIFIGGLPHMAAVTRDNTKILLLASEETADIDAEIIDEATTSYFSRLLPHAMALRYIFGEECWRPFKSFASVIIDDPLLRRNYGYLNFPSVLRLTREINFHTTISFIPHNYRRSSKQVTRMFRENSDRLSICFHGNDHTKAEFLSTDSVLLNRTLAIAEDRMNTHERATGLHCNRAMVFPQDDYSVEALEVLKSRNFWAAVSSPRPSNLQISLTIRDLAQPAVIRYGGVPVFTRAFIRHTQSPDIAFNVFFGKPILIGEHHDAFKDTRPLLELVKPPPCPECGPELPLHRRVILGATVFD